MLSESAVAPDEGVRTYVRGGPVSLSFDELVKSCPQLIALRINVGRKEAVVLRRVALFDALKRNDWQVKKSVPLQEFFLNTKSDHRVLRIVLEVFVSDFREGAIADKKEFAFLLHG
jgi:hypothetical protein